MPDPGWSWLLEVVLAPSVRARTCLLPLAMRTIFNGRRVGWGVSLAWTRPKMVPTKSACPEEDDDDDDGDSLNTKAVCVAPQDTMGGCVDA